MMWRRSTPSVLRSLGSPVLGYAHLEDGRLMGVYKDFFAIAQPDDNSSHVLTHEWIEVASARWDQPTCQLHFSFIDSSVPTLTVTVCSGQSEDIAPLIHERVDSSFFWRQRQKLPSGVEAVFMIRSGKKSRLSIQTLYDKTPSAEDEKAIASMHERMRDLANIRD